MTHRHEKKDVSLITPPIWIAFLFMLAVTILDLMILISPTNIIDPSSTRLVLHGILSLATIGAVAILLQRKVDSRFLLIFALFLLTLGPLGALTVLFSMVLYLVYTRITQPLSNLLSSLMPDMRRDQSDIVYDRILYHLDDFHPNRIPIPFKDIMVFGSYKQKRMAIEKMLRYYRPAFSQALKLGLEDKSNAVRVQAATAISFIDHKLLNETLKLKRQVEENKDDLDLLLLYAKQTEKYALSEILDPDRKDKMLQAGIDAYTAYLEKDPEDLEAMLSLAKMQFAAKNYYAAKHTLQELLLQKFSPEAALLMMQTLYQLSEYDELRLMIQQNESKFNEHPAHDELHESAKFWSTTIEAEESAPERVL